MSWITTQPYDQAKGRLKTLYDRVKGPNNNVDNIMLAHSLRPHTMEGHMAIYKNVLHHSGNTLPKWFLESIGVWVSQLNQCDYCVEHHFSGLKRLINDDARIELIWNSFAAGKPDETVFTVRERLALDYAKALTREPSAISQATIDELRVHGFEDGQILEINQVTAYFNYANRTVLGLGVSTEGDVLGLSPGNSEKPSDWSHR